MSTRARDETPAWAGYGVVLAVAAVSRLLLSFLPVNYISEGQRVVFSWKFFVVLAVVYLAAAALAARSGLPAPESTGSGPRRGWVLPAFTGLAVAILTILSDMVSPVAEIRGVPTVHVSGLAAIPFYAYGAVLLTSVFHFAPIALAAWLAQSFQRGARAALLIGAIAVTALSEDAGYFLRNPSLDSVEAWRHVLSIFANGAESFFILRFGLLAGLTQRFSTYLIWHILWPAIGR